MIRVAMRSLAAGFAVGVMLALLSALAGGCAGFKAPAYSGLAAVVEAADAARVQLPPACEKAQNSAVDAAKDRPGAMAIAKTIQDRCDAAATGIEATGKIAKTARDGIYDASTLAKDPAAAMKWALAAFDSYKNLSSLLSTFGVKLPQIPGVN